MSDRKLNRLRAAFNKRYSTWLERAEPEIARALEDEIADGASQDEIAKFAKEVSGEQDWFTKRVIGAAQHIENEQAKRR